MCWWQSEQKRWQASRIFFYLFKYLWAEIPPWHCTKSCSSSTNQRCFWQTWVPKKEKKLFQTNLTWQHSSSSGSSSRHCCRRAGGFEWRVVDCVFIENICDLDVLHRRGVEVQLGRREAALNAFVWWTVISRLQAEQALHEIFLGWGTGDNLWLSNLGFQFCVPVVCFKMYYI